MMRIQTRTHDQCRIRSDSEGNLWNPLAESAEADRFRSNPLTVSLSIPLEAMAAALVPSELSIRQKYLEVAGPQKSTQSWSKFMSIPDSWAPNFGHSDGKCFGPKMVLKIPKSDLTAGR